VRQPDRAAVAEQLDSIADKIGRQFPLVERMMREAEADICAFPLLPGRPLAALAPPSCGPLLLSTGPKSGAPNAGTAPPPQSVCASRPATSRSCVIASSIEWPALADGLRWWWITRVAGVQARKFLNAG